MIDRILARRSAKLDVLSTDGYKPEHVITARTLLNPDADRLCVLFPPWHGGGRAFQRLASRLAAKDSAVLSYSFHDEILKPDVSEVLRSFQVMQEMVTDDLNRLADSSKYQNIKLVALSLGNPALAMVTGKFNRFDSVSFVLSATSLASSMWYGIRTQHIRAGIERQGLGLEDIERAWAPMAPVNHVDALAGKKVEMLISTNDEIIPSSYQQSFAATVRANDINPTVRSTKLGHYAAIGVFCLHGGI